MKGQTLIEVLVAVVVIVLLVGGVTGLSVLTTRLSVQSERHTVALGIVNTAIESARTLPFADVGLSDAQSGEALGILARAETVNQNNQTYTLTRSIQYFDDPLTPQPDTDIKKI